MKKTSIDKRDEKNIYQKLRDNGQNNKIQNELRNIFENLIGLYNK